MLPRKMLTLELRMSHICDARGRALSAAVAFLRRSSRVALSARSQAAQRDFGVNPYLLSSNKSRPHLSTYIIVQERQEGAVLVREYRESDKGYYTRSFLSNGESKRLPVFTYDGSVTFE